MKGISAKRIQFQLGETWKSPDLHVLLTQEDSVIVARCLDFTVSSHGENERDALQSLGDAIKEYLLTAIEENAMDMIFDPAQNKYWRMFNEIEAKTTRSIVAQRVNEIADLAKELPESALEELFDFAQFLKIKKQEFSYKEVADSTEYVRSLRLREGKKIKSGEIFIQELIEWQKSSHVHT